MATSKKNNYISNLKRIIIPEHIKGLKHYTYAHFIIGEQFPFYVGIGTQYPKTSLYYRAKSKNRSKVWKGYTNNKEYMVIICSESENYEIVKTYEKEMIFEYGKKKDGGFLINLTDGGDGCIGYKHTSEYLEKLKIRMSGCNSPMFGKPISEKNRILLSKKFTGTGNNMFNKRTKTAKIIYKLNNEGEIIEEFPSLRNAAKNEGISHSCIGESIKLNTKANGFKWKYKNGN